MSKRLLRSLVLACALPLALPPGWCCVPAAAPVRETPKAASCCHRQPQEAPALPPPTTACCCDQDATEPPGRLAPAVDAAVAVLPPVVVAVVERDADQPPVERPPTVLSPPLHILHCLWLC